MQETKKESFDEHFIWKISPPQFDKFEYLPSRGASGGCITIWKSSVFDGSLAFMNEFGLSVHLTSTHTGANWVLTNIYGPCIAEKKDEFLDWLINVDMPMDCDWLLTGDFNLIRYPDDRNREGGNINEML